MRIGNVGGHRGAPAVSSSGAAPLTRKNSGRPPDVTSVTGLMATPYPCVNCKCRFTQRCAWEGSFQRTREIGVRMALGAEPAAVPETVQEPAAGQ